MSGSVRFTAAALADLDEAAEWYNKQRPMLGVQFLEAVRETTNRIAANPKVSGSSLKTCGGRTFPAVGPMRCGMSSSSLIRS